MHFMGIDCHTNCFTACYKQDGFQDQIRTFNLQTDLKVFLETLTHEDEIALEATENSAFFRNQVLYPIVKTLR
jgi:hypothetical protein